MDIWTGFKRTAFRMTLGWKEQEMFLPSDALFLYTQYRVFFMIQSNIRYFILAKNYRGGYTGRSACQEMETESISCI